MDALAETPAVEEAETRTDTQVKVKAEALLDALVSHGCRRNGRETKRHIGLRKERATSKNFGGPLIRSGGRDRSSHWPKLKQKQYSMLWHTR